MGLLTDFLGPDFSVVCHVGQGIFSIAAKERIRRVQLLVGLHKGSPGEFSCTQSLPLGALLDGRLGLVTRFLGPDFSVVCHVGQGYIYGCCKRANTEGPVACGAA